MPKKITNDMIKDYVDLLADELGLEFRIAKYTPDGVRKETYYKLEVYKGKHIIHHFDTKGDSFYTKREFYAFIRGSLSALDWVKNKEKHFKNAGQPFQILLKNGVLNFDNKNK